MTVAFSPDGSMLVAGYDDGALRLWDPTTGAVLRVIAAHRNNVLDVAFSPDGRVLASGGYDNLVRTWDVATGTQLRELDGHRGDRLDSAHSEPGRVTQPTHIPRPLSPAELEKGGAGSPRKGPPRHSKWRGD
jgi:WD40 repeat protein